MLRMLRALSQEQMANLLNISQQAYSKIERHDWIDHKQMEKILSALKCHNHELESLKKIVSIGGSDPC